MNEITYKFDDFVISYNKGHNKDRSALLISKIDKINICILGESADIINTMINNLQQENKQLKERIDKVKEYLTNAGHYYYDEDADDDFFCDDISARDVLKILKGE